MKTAMIWGASGGIGRALAQQLTDAGWQVAAVTRYPDKVEDVAETTIEISNIGNPGDVDKAVYTVQFEMDEVDLWVYAVGDIAQAKVEDMESAEWSRILNANLTGAFVPPPSQARRPPLLPRRGQRATTATQPVCLRRGEGGAGGIRRHAQQGAAQAQHHHRASRRGRHRLLGKGLPQEAKRRRRPRENRPAHHRRLR